jgi:PGAP1-like protein
VAEAGAAWLRALSGAVGDALAEGVARVEEMHRAIAGRSFAAVGPGATGVRAAHDGISRAVYAGIRGGARLAGRAAGAVAALTPLAETDWARRPEVALLEGAIGGAFGDHVEARHPALAPRMAVRLAGHDVPLDRGSLAAALPHAEARVAIFLHGLCETEAAWGRPALDDDAPGTYGDRLRRHLGHSPVFLRYNSGLHVSENGRALADLLEAATASWPVDVEEIALVGHSMGGLVARSACHLASSEEAAWVRRVRHVVSVGTPHTGAPLAQAAHYATAALDAVPETRPLAGFLRRRSAGIRDLRQGSLVDEDWRDRDPDALRAQACREIPLLEGAAHCFVAATLTRSPRHPLGRLLGDSLVLVPSASGRSRTRRIPFRDDDGALLGGTHHLALLNHPAVYERLREWLAATPA